MPVIPRLDLGADAADLTAQLIEIPSVSGEEGPLCEAVLAALSPMPHLDVDRVGNTVVARTHGGRDTRVIIAGHLDTVPPAGNLAPRREGDLLHGLGACDMKAGVAVALRLAASLTDPGHEVTYLFYDNEEAESERNGLGQLAHSHPDLISGDLAILMEPSDGAVECGCQGTLTVEVTIPGRRAHTARAWTGENAIHRVAPVLARLAQRQSRRPVVDGLTYIESVSAVGIHGGVTDNVVPDECRLTVNHRFAPDRSADEALADLQDAFGGYPTRVLDMAPAAPPMLDRPGVRAFVDAVRRPARPKLGWTDVARFAGLGIPALNFGPGDPLLAHRADEHVDVTQIADCEQRLRDWLTPPR